MSNLRNSFTILFVGFLLLVSAEAFAVDWAGLTSDLGAYEADIAGISQKMGSVADYKSSLVLYLAANQSEANSMKATITAAGKNDLELLKKLRDFNAKRLVRKDKVILDVEDNDKTPRQQEIEKRSLALLQKENQSWTAHVSPYLSDPFIGDLAVRKKLFELKYFEEDDPKQANLFEGWLNGALPFTRYKEGEQAWYRKEGVSKWEATVRVEPIVLLKDGNHAGVLLAGGMLYNFFPEVLAKPDDPFQVSVNDDLLSMCLKRTGLKIGAGAVFDDPKTEFLSGIGIQMRAWSFWGTYSTGDSRFSVAVSLSDWDWVKKMLPLFNP